MLWLSSEKYFPCCCDTTILHLLPLGLGLGVVFWRWHFSSFPVLSVWPSFNLFISPTILTTCKKNWNMAVSVTPIRDTKWLTLEVCREFQRGTCSRPDTECKFAHPSKSCQVENGRVIACFDSLKVSKHHHFPPQLEDTYWLKYS